MRRIVGAAVAGFVGMALVVSGVSLPSSPFTSKLPGSWIFGIPAAGSAPAHHALIGIAVVYAGIVVVLCAWYCIVTYPIPDDPRLTRRLSLVFAAWVVPLIVAPPLFSRDAYTYGAEGQLVRRGVDPYTHGLAPVRGSRFYTLADPLWRHAHAPYGPVFFDIARVDAKVSSSVFATLEGYRLVAVLGVVLIAVSVPVLARSFGRDPATAFALAALNPLVLLSLVGGMHNDAIMVGLLLAALALARRGHPMVGIVVCGIGALVKVPCFLGVVFIGWDWAGVGSPPRRRGSYVTGSVALGLVVMAVISSLSGFGWAWLWNLSDPGKVNSWLDPATAVGLSATHVLRAFGAAPDTHGLVVAARAIALVVAGVIVIVLLVRTDRYGVARALGWSLVAVVFLGPIVWPWYETWGLVVLALAPDAWSRRAVLVLSAVACFATVPSHVSATTGDIAVAALGLGALCVGAFFTVRRMGRGVVVAADS